MATNYNPTELGQPLQGAGDDGNGIVFFDSCSSTTTVVAGVGDKLRVCRVSGGVDVHRVIIKNVDLDTGTSLTATIGFENLDGTTTASLTAVAADGAWAQTAATTTYEIIPPYRVEKDAFLTIKVTAAATGVQAGVLTTYGKVEGRAIGVK